MTTVLPQPAAPPRVEPPSEERSDYFNRELSWLAFNERVLEEALDPGVPLLERIKFVSIFGSNLDEFFMIRVSGLRGQVEAGITATQPDGMSASQQLEAVHATLLPALARCNTCLSAELLPALRRQRVVVLTHDELREAEREALRGVFQRQIFPVLTPLAFDPGHPFPHISNLSLNLAVVVRDALGEERFARLKVPRTLPRLVPVPAALGDPAEEGRRFVWLEELVAANIDQLFPELEVIAAWPFRVTRDADLEIELDEASDLLTMVTEGLERRQFGTAVRLEIDDTMPDRIEAILAKNLRLQPHLVYRQPAPLGIADLQELAALDVPELRDPPLQARLPPALAARENLFKTIAQRDIVLHHPYESFAPVVDFIRSAAEDPDVLAIKQTLYRVGRNSPIVEALMAARENGKQVSVLVELKARFDERNNIVWARALESAGVHVVYGLLELKTHAKMCLVVRRESQGLRSYVHLSTGNYNPLTARAYTDFGFFTCDREIVDDVADLFNALTGYSRKAVYRKLVVSPGQMLDALLARIEREIEHHRRHGGGFLAFKLNALVDRNCIAALYRASSAGVRVELQLRGICCLRPGVPGLSENIRVTSIVGRFLEHSRIFYFRNGGDEEILLGSADLMPRNLYNRVEVLFPIADPEHKRRLREILFLHLLDNTKSRLLLPSGAYERLRPASGGPVVDSQQRLVDVGPWQIDSMA